MRSPFILEISMFSCFALLAPKAGAAGKKHVVAIEKMTFNPKEIHLSPGDSITWVNKDLVPHTVTATDKSFDSKAIPPGESWNLKDPKGVTYSCTMHPAMTGLIKKNKH